MKRKGTGLFARYAYVTTALGTKRHRVTNKERAEAYRLRAKHKDIMEMQPPRPLTQTSAVSEGLPLTAITSIPSPTKVLPTPPPYCTTEWTDVKGDEKKLF